LRVAHYSLFLKDNFPDQPQPTSSLRQSMTMKGEITQELQLYLEEKNLNALFVTIVEAILTKVSKCRFDSLYVW
jgi:hypothetical protein